MKREWIAFILLIPILFLAVFYPEKNPVEKIKNEVTIHDDFFTLLGKQTGFWKAYVRDADVQAIERFRYVYDKNKHLQYDASPNFRIPKTIHVIWLGPLSFPRESVDNIRSWIAHHPDWTFVFWTDRPRPPPCTAMEVRMVDSFQFQFLKKEFDEAKNWAEKSDILRYEILYKEGGIYIDHDANCLRPFHGLHSGYDFYCCLELPHQEVENLAITAGIGIIGSKPMHPVIRGCIDLVHERWDTLTKAFDFNDPETRRELVLHRTYMAMTHSLKKNIDLSGNNDIVFPASYFYGKNPLPSLYSHHFYGGKWEGKQGIKSKLISSVPAVLGEMKFGLKRLIKLEWLTSGVLLLSCVMLIRIRRKMLRVLPFLLLFSSSLCAGESEFGHLMGEKRNEYGILTQEDFQNFDFFKEIYEKNKAPLQTKNERIPKKIHFVWFGPSPLPKDSVKNIKSWYTYHPDWEFTLWTDRERETPLPFLKIALVQKLKFAELTSCFHAASTYREKADVLRYEILYQLGGVVVDHDVACHRSFSQFHTNYDFYAGMQPVKRATISSSVVVSNSIVGAKPMHPILRLCLALVNDKWQMGDLYFPAEDKDSNIYRIFYRIFSPLDQAVKARINHVNNRDIVFPVGYFNKIENDFGIYAHHKYGTTWFDGETKAQRELKEQIEALSRKQNELLQGSLLLSVLALILLGGTLYLHKKMA